MFHRPVEGLEERTLRLAREGTTFGLVCDQIASALAGTDPELAAQTAFRLLARWVNDGLLEDALDR